MKVQETVRRETLRVAMGTICLTALMLLVFLLLGKLGWPELLGAVIGAFAAILDFFLLGLSVQNAAEYQAAHPLPPQPEEAEETEVSSEPEDAPQTCEAPADDRKRPFADPETAGVIKKKMQRSFYLRRLLLVAFAALGLLPCFSLFTVVIPMLFPKLVIYIINFADRKKGGNA